MDTDKINERREILERISTSIGSMRVILTQYEMALKDPSIEENFNDLTREFNQEIISCKNFVGELESKI